MHRINGFVVNKTNVSLDANFLIIKTYENFKGGLS